MCGIAGGIRHTLTAPDGERVLARLRHRGPDDHGIWQESDVWLANTRLAIRDLSGNGHQPMRSADGRYTIVFNGELYNHLQLRSRLEAAGIAFTSLCDTETLLYAYAQWGRDCLALLEGDYAFAVHDAVKKEVFLARDPLGVKPLYYYDDGRKFLFASELKALLDMPGADYSLQPEIFHDYLLFLYSPSANTPFRHIKKLLPGHLLRIPVSGPFALQPERHYRIPFTGQYETARRTKEWAGLLDAALTNTLSGQLHADAPVGLTLSGGLDSSLIAALARRARPGQQIHAFTINTQGGMKEEGFSEDLRYAQTLAKAQDITLHEVSGHIDIAAELDGMIWQLDEPQADPAALHMAHISKAAQDYGIKVLLSGTGGDDVFSGYRRHTAIPALGAMRFMPRAFGKLMESIARMLPENVHLRRLAKLTHSAGLSPVQAAVCTHFWAAPERVQGLFREHVLPEHAGGMAYRIFRDLLEEIPGEQDLLQQMLFWEMRTFLPHHNLAYMDKMGMAHSVEVRVPFTDTRIISLAAQMPPSMKMQKGITKYILREVAKSYLPAEIINREKTGFGAPLRQWMQGALMDVVSARILDESFLRRGIFKRSAIEQLIADSRRGRMDGAYTLFSLLSIESWLRQFAPSA